MVVKDEIFREYDIRGIVGESLDKEVAFQVGRAFGAYLKKVNPFARQASVGRDVRLSSDDLADGTINGILATGLDVYDIGDSPFRIEDMNMTDGIRVVFERGWWLVRASNTQPAVVMRMEAEDESALHAYKEFVEGEIEKAGEAT